jgi:hypothetical protein
MIEALRGIQIKLHEEGIPGSLIIGKAWKDFADSIFGEFLWGDLLIKEKIILLKFRFLLIENQRRDLTEEESEYFKDLSLYILENHLFEVELPKIYNSFESFIIKLAIKKECRNGNYSEATFKGK